MACYTDYDPTSGAHAFRFEWEPNTNGLRCTPNGWGDNTKTAYTYYGYGIKTQLRDGTEHQSFVVEGRWSPIQDGGMGAFLGIWLNDIHRDSKDSRFGNIGIGAMLWCMANKNGTQEILSDNVGWFGNWVNGEWGDNGLFGKSVLRWLSLESGSNTRTETYVDSSGDIPGGIERRMPQWDSQGFQNHDSYNVPTALFVENGSDVAAQSPIWSGALWPRVYWNRKGKAGARNDNDENPRRFDDDHGVITALVGINWTGCGPRLGTQYHGQNVMSVPVIVPDLKPGDQGWIKALPGYPTIDEVGVDETSITLRYNVTQWQPQENRAFDDNECYQMILGDRSGGKVNGVSTGYYTWKVTGLTPGTCYSFYNMAQSNPKEYEGKAYKYSSKIYRQTMKRPSNPTSTNNSRWDTPSVNVNVADWGNDTKYCNDANTTQKIRYVFNNSPTDTSGYSTTDYINGNDTRVWGTWHSKNQDAGFWVHLQAVNNWGTSEWVHIYYETPDRLYRPGARKQSTWRSHQALNGKSHRCVGGWEEMTTRSEYAPNGTKHPDDPPFKRESNRWKNQELEGTDPTWYAETGWGNVN